MARYYYDKYNVQTEWREPPFKYTRESSRKFKYDYKNASWDKVNKRWILSEEWKIYETVRLGSVCYSYGSGNLCHKSVATEDYISTDDYAPIQLYTSDGNEATVLSESRGTLVQSDILAEEGTYPSNGKHTDGYWYVRQSGQAPRTVTSLTLSKTNDLSAGEEITISWSGASDPEGQLTNHYLEARLNGGNWTAVATKNTSSGSSSHNYIIPAGTSSIQFRVRVRDAQNLYSSYRETTTYSVINNTAPTISGTDRSLGDYALPFTVDFTVDDANPSDSIAVRVTLNGTEIMNISGAPRNQPLTININKQLFDPLAVGSTNTIQIRADDGQGGIAYRTLTFRKTNTAPLISGNDEDLGIIEESPTYTYTVSDAEDDAITIVERVNSVVIREFEAIPNEEYIFSIPHEAWLHFWPQNDYTIYIEATDARGAKSVRSLSFKRKTDKSVITLKNPFETDVHAQRILLNPTVTIPTGAIFTVEACNNAFDESPTWEDITERALEGRGYIFTNDVKTADKWGVNVRITLERGTATTPIILDGFGGAFD